MISIAIAPSYNARITKKSINFEETVYKYGRVSGSLFIHCFPPPTFVEGAKLVLESDYLKRITFSGILGKFRFNFVPVGKQYTLTVTHPKFKTVTETFTLSADNLDFKISIAMTEKNKIKSRTTIGESECLGSIYGNTGTSHDWVFSSVFFARVEAGGKTTISSPIMGYYKINNLPFCTYKITGSKKGYDTFTDTVTLTENRPNKQVFIHLEPNDIKLDINKK